MDVTSVFSVRCVLDLHVIGQRGSNVEYIKESGVVIMEFRNPPATAIICSSGTIFITGSKSEEHAKKSARQCARALQKLGFDVRFLNYKVLKGSGTSSMPFAKRIWDFADKHPNSASSKPELHPDVTNQPYQPRAPLKTLSTDNITVTAPAVGNIKFLQ